VKHLLGFVVAVALAVGGASLVVSNSSDAAPTLPNYWGLAERGDYLTAVLHALQLDPFLDENAAVACAGGVAKGGAIAATSRRPAAGHSCCAAGSACFPWDSILSPSS
jgi:hypothetical protein